MPFTMAKAAVLHNLNTVRNEKIIAKNTEKQGSDCILKWVLFSLF